MRERLGRGWELLRFLTRERLCLTRCGRQPEPCALMDRESSVRAFLGAGRAGGALWPLHHLNALVLSRLLPAGGTYLDLGCGAAGFAVHLAGLRPDLRILGLDLAEAMLAAGRRLVQERRLGSRIELRRGDFTAFLDGVPERIDVAGCIFALHHLPQGVPPEGCLGEMRRLHERDGALLWIFDFARPRNARSASEFGRLFHAQTDPGLQDEARDSLAAAFTFDEVTEAWRRAGLGPGYHRRSRLLPFYQSHALWAEGARIPGGCVSSGPITAKDLRVLRLLHWMFPGLPLPVVAERHPAGTLG